MENKQLWYAEDKDGETVRFFSKSCKSVGAIIKKYNLSRVIHVPYHMLDYTQPATKEIKNGQIVDIQ